jgi:nucleoside-diphosphate-sugar epimerase
MTILFIGGTGNISADCAALLHERGHAIAILSRGQKPVPAAYRAVRGDRHDPESLRQSAQLARPDVIINFLGYDVADVQADYEAFNGAVRQYIFISSASVYAKPPRRLPITEDAPLGNPWWDYSRRKLACEEWLLARRDETGFPATIVRPSHTYSKAWIPNPLSSSSYTFAARLEHGKPVFIPDDGETPWALTASSDFAAGLAGLVGNDKAVGESFHITSDEALTWNQIYAEIAAALGVDSPQIVKVPTDFICEVVPRLVGTLKGDKAHPGVFDNSKMKRFVPEFVCRKSFRLGVRESVNWLRHHPEEQNLRPELDRETEDILARFANLGTLGT